MPARARSSVVPGRVVGGDASSAQVAEIQRSRLLAAAVGAVDELGYANTTVADVDGSRAGVAAHVL